MESNQTKSIQAHRMNFDRISGARGVIRVLKFMGLWHFGAPWQTLYRAYSYLLHFAFTFPYTIMMWVDVVQASSLEKFTYIMYMSLTELALLSKVTNIWLHARMFVEFFRTVSEAEMFALRTAQERSAWVRIQRYYRLLAATYFFMSITLVTNAFIGVLFADDYELPFPYAPPFEWRNERSYWYAYGYEVLAMPVTCLANCALDMIQCYALLHLALCYKLIGQRLEQLGKTHSDDQMSGSFSEGRFRNQLLQIIQLHKLTKRLSKDIEVFMSFPFMIQILCSSFVLCFSAYRLQSIRILDNPSQFFTLILAVMVMTLQIFVPCYCGNEVILSSHALNNALYHADWLQCSPKLRKFIFTYMEFMKNPVKIRAGTFFEIGLPIFRKTMNNTYSLMALLMNMNK